MTHFAKFNLRSVLLCVFSFLLFTFSGNVSGQTLIAGWDFQTAPGTAVSVATSTPKLYNSNVGSGVLYLDGTNGASNWSQTTELTAFAGSALNAGGSTGLSTTTTSPACLALLGGTSNSANGKTLVFKVNMTGYQNLIITYATQKTATGFSTQLWEYSTNGTTWSAIGTISTIPTAFAVQTLTAISGLNGISNAFVRLTITGATNATGNNRLDNIQFNATLIPVPTLTATPTIIPAFNYVFGNGPSASSSYNLSGSVLTPSADTIKIFAPTNFEISKTAGSGFKDSLNIRYSGGTFAPIPIYARLKAGLAVSNAYGDTIRHSGGGVSMATLPKVRVSGSVTSVPPPVINTTRTLSPFYTIVGSPSASQSYTVAGVNLVSDITITAPTDFEIKTGAGAYANTLILTPSSGSVPATTIDIRLKGITAGSFTGQNITNVSTTASVNIPITGTVGASCGVATDIATVRALVPPVATNTGGTANYTVTGTITGIFGLSKFYVEDATGGIAVFSTNVVSLNSLAVGDQVTLSGIPVRFNGEAQLNGPITNPSPLTRGPIPCITKISTGTAPAPLVFNANTPPLGVNLPTFLDNNEGKLVKIISINLLNTGTFAVIGSGTNFPITACNSQGDGEIRIDATATTIVSQPIPTVSQDITGVVGNYINASGTVNILQLFPRTIADFTNSSVACITPIPSPSASCGPLGSQSIPADSTLDVTCWNVEWLGNTTTSPSALGPTNDAQQMTNVLQVLNTVKSDIFCIEEVCDHKQFIARVKTDLPKYKVRCQTKYYSHFFDSPETTSATTFSQKVCFVYDSTVVTAVDTISLLASQYGYNLTPVPTPYPNNWASGRLPFMFIGDVKIGNVTKQIHFVGLHAKSGSAVADYNRRKQDVIDLKAKLDTDYPNANIMMLGDYNDDLDTSIAAGKASSYANFVNDNVNYKQVSRALSLCGVSSTAKYTDIIDHFMLSNEFGVLPASGATPSPSLSGIYYLEKTINVSRPINYVTNYTTTTSDHYPVNARFTFKLPSEIVSISSGNWSSSSTWNCSCVPSSSSNVTIDATHTVTVDAASQARSLNVKGTLNWLASFMLSLGQ
jgi:hypothetical protein